MVYRSSRTIYHRVFQINKVNNNTFRKERKMKSVRQTVYQNIAVGIYATPPTRFGILYEPHSDIDVLLGVERVAFSTIEEAERYTQKRIDKAYHDFPDVLE